MSIEAGLSKTDPPASNPEDILIERLIAEFQLSTAEQLRLHALRAALDRHGVFPTDAAFVRWLSPVFCGSPEEQTQFLDRFQALRAEVAPPPSSHPSSRLGPPVTRGRTSPTPTGETPPPEIDDVATRRRRDTLVLGLVGAGLLVALGFLMLLLGGQEIRLPGVEPSPPAQIPILGDAFFRIERTAAGWGLKFALGPWALLGFVPLLLGTALSLFLFARLRRERRAFRPTPEVSRPIALGNASGDYFGSQEVRRSLQSLARHGGAPGLRLNIRRSLRATVRNAGYPTLRFGSRPKLPDYVLLIDREAPRDHLPLVGEMLARRLRRQHATVTCFAFNRRPQVLLNLDDPSERLTGLSELTAGVNAARILVLAETDRLVRATGAPIDWLQDLASSANPMVLDPRAESDWGGDEAALHLGGLPVLPATQDGVLRYAEWLATGRVAPAAAPPAPPRLDLPFQLSRHRAMLLSAEPLEGDLLEGLLQDLAAWLGEDLMRLLRALAVFPRLEPSLTLALGKALKTADGRLPLLNDDSLLDVVRLPWLRAGRMPDQLRERLVRDLSRNDLRTTVRIVHAFLISDTETLRHRNSRPPRRPDLLVHWLRQSEDSDLHDPLLIDAIDGRAPDKLGTPPDPGLLERLRQTTRRPALLSAVVTVAAASVGMWLQPLYDGRRVPTSAPAEKAGTQGGGDREIVSFTPTESGSAEEDAFARAAAAAAEAAAAAVSTGDVSAEKPPAQRPADESSGKSPSGSEAPPDPQQSALTVNRDFIVYFPFDQSVLTPEAQSQLQRAVDFTREVDAVGVKVTGHSDSLSSNSESLRVSERRASAVRQALVSSGLPYKLISLEAKGETAPAVATADGVKEPLNRRVEISVSYRGSEPADR